MGIFRSLKGWFGGNVRSGTKNGYPKATPLGKAQGYPEAVYSGAAFLEEARGEIERNLASHDIANLPWAEEIASEIGIPNPRQEGISIDKWMRRHKDQIERKLRADGRANPFAGIPHAEEIPEAEVLEYPEELGYGDYPDVPFALRGFILFGEWLDVSSSNVGSIQYKIDSSELFIQFLNGGIYQYQNRSVSEAIDFAQSGSPGGWVWDHLRVRGTVFGYQKPYQFLSGLSTWQPRWMQTYEKAELHGRVRPSGEAPSYTKEETEMLLLSNDKTMRKSIWDRPKD